MPGDAKSLSPNVRRSRARGLFEHPALHQSGKAGNSCEGNSGADSGRTEEFWDFDTIPTTLGAKFTHNVSKNNSKKDPQRHGC